MNPFYFGTAERRLFGIYEPAAVGTAGKRAAIICYPWGAEYLYAHRTLRQLALKLSGTGFHTLRFDFYGTGDSDGEPTDIDLAGWEADLETAIEELTEITGLTRVTLIGLRLGAVIAAGVASRLRGKIEELVLWDPIVSGPEYLAELGVEPGARPPIEAQGFPLTERLLEALSALDLSALISKFHPRTSVFITKRLPSHDLLVPLTGGPEMGQFSVEFLTDSRPWLEDSVSFGVVPFSVMQRISNWLND
jgi:pimeloyl-ACP methyl ester carboxylesterase